MKKNLFPSSALYEDTARFAESQSSMGKAAPFKNLWEKLADFGVFMMPLPKSHGGLELSSAEICDTWEALGEKTGDGGLLLAAGTHLWAVMKPLLDFGTAEQISAWLPGMIAGEVVGAYAASEAEAGSDIMSLKTSCKLEGAEYVINGSKMWTTNAPYADVFIVFATHDSRLHYRGLSAFLVPRNTPGLSVGTAERKIGLHSAEMACVYLDDCRVPKEALLGKSKRAAEIFRTTLLWERTFMLAPAVGTMRRQIKGVIDYANERKQFGQAIGKFQAVSHRIANMYANYWQARQIFRKAAYEIVHNDNGFLASVANLVLGNAALDVHLNAVKCFGAVGYMHDSNVGADIQDAIGGQIYSGTSDIQKNIIAENIGL